MYKLVIFDLDGTLLNTIGDLAESCNYALSRCGYRTHSAEQYKFFVGNGIMKLIERALPEEGRDAKTIREMREYFLWHYSKHNNIHTKPYDGVLELLKRLHDDNCMLAVASNKYQEATEQIIKSYFKEIKFIKILGQREGIPVKPDPYIIKEILSFSNTRPEECIYVGDSGVDAATAANINGLKYIGVTWGFRGVDEQKLYGATTFADTPETIWRIYKK